jgi:hypothetical protein
MSLKSDDQKNRIDSTKLNIKLISHGSFSDMPKSADLLGALDKSNPDDEAYLFKSEYHADVTQDFCLHDTYKDRLIG